MFVNPSGEARNIFILSSTEGGVTGQKVSAETKSVGPFELLARRVARENELLPCTKLFEKNPASPEGKGITGLFAREEQAIQLARVPYYVVSTRERGRGRDIFPCSSNNFTERVYRDPTRGNILNCYRIDFAARNCSTYNKYLTERIHRLK